MKTGDSGSDNGREPPAKAARTLDDPVAAAASASTAASLRTASSATPYLCPPRRRGV
jgi:hypothetical protein